MPKTPQLMKQQQQNSVNNDADAADIVGAVNLKISDNANVSASANHVNKSHKFLQFVGPSCGHHAAYTFYKAIKYTKNGETKILGKLIQINFIGVDIDWAPPSS